MRIGVIASIAHRLPPAGVRAVGADRLDPHRGFVEHGHEVTLFATADSATTARLHPTAPHGYEEDPAVDAKVWEGLHNAAAFERADRVRRHREPLRLHAADLQPLVDDPRRDDDPRVLLAPRSSRSTRAYDDIAHYVAISDADRHPRPALRGHHPPRHRHRRRSPSSPSRAATCCSSAGSTPTRAPTSPSRSPGEAGLPLVIAGIVQDEDYFDDAGAAPRRRRARPLRRSRWDRPSVTPCSAGRWRCCTSSTSPSRSACPWSRPWPPGHRSSPRPAARCRSCSARRTGFLVGDDAEAVARSARLAELDRAECRGEADTRFDAGRMVDDYLALFERLTSGSDPGTVEVQG